VVDLDQNPIAQLPPHNPDQNIVVPVGTRAVNMAEDRTLLPEPFRGTPDQDASEFWRRLKTYMTYKDLDAASRLRLATAMMTKLACDWIEKLPDADKLTIDDLQTAFEKRYIKPAALRFRSACEVFQRKQEQGELVDAYAVRVRKLAKRIPMDDSTLLYAFVSGLRPKIASFVLGRNPDNINNAIDDARIGELSTAEASGAENSALTEQLNEMRKDIQRMAQRYDSMTISAPLQTERPRSPMRKVTFEDEGTSESRGRETRRPSPGRAESSFGSFSRGNYRNYFPQRSRGSSQFIPRARGMRTRGTFRGNFQQATNFTPTAGYNPSGYDQQSCGQRGFDQSGYNQPGYNQPQPF